MGHRRWTPLHATTPRLRDRLQQMRRELPRTCSASLVADVILECRPWRKNAAGAGRRIRNAPTRRYIRDRFTVLTSRRTSASRSCCQIG